MALEIEHQEPGVAAGRVVAFCAGFVAFALLLGGGLGVYYRWVIGGNLIGTPVATFPNPQLQPDPAADWVAFHGAQERQLDGTGWADQDKGLVRLPIQEAMTVVAARGTAAYDPVAGTPPFPAPGQPPLDGARRATPQPMAAPYGRVR